MFRARQESKKQNSRGGGKGLNFKPSNYILLKCRTIILKRL